jgi:hypothetical protein
VWCLLVLLSSAVVALHHTGVLFQPPVSIPALPGSNLMFSFAPHPLISSCASCSGLVLLYTPALSALHSSADPLLFCRSLVSFLWAVLPWCFPVVLWSVVSDWFTVQSTQWSAFCSWSALIWASVMGLHPMQAALPRLFASVAGVSWSVGLCSMWLHWVWLTFVRSLLVSGSLLSLDLADSVGLLGSFTGSL